MDKIFPYYGATSCMDYVDNYIFDGIYTLIGEDGSVVKEDGLPYMQYVWGKLWVNNHAHILQGKNGFSTETAEENNTTNNIISTFLKKINTPSSKKEETTDEIAERLADLVVERFKDIMQEGKNIPTDDIETVNTVKNRKEETIKTGFLGFNNTKED